jgi:hypothetical protein
MTLTGRTCLAMPCDVHECASQFVGQRSIRPLDFSPTGDNVESQNGQFVQFILQKRQPRCQNFQLRSGKRVPFDDDSFSGGKVRSVSAMGQSVNVIRRKETPRTGSIIMEHFSHQQNLAHCRRLLAEAELATSSDEIRHSMLMRLLAEEEAYGLLIFDDGDPAPNAKDDAH